VKIKQLPTWDDNADRHEQSRPPLEVIEVFQMHRVTTHATIPISGNRLDAPRAEHLTRTLEAVPGVTSVFIGLQTEMAFIVYDPKQIDLNTLKSLIG
jgi:hypothetical protein